MAHKFSLKEVLTIMKKRLISGLVLGLLLVLGGTLVVINHHKSSTRPGTITTKPKPKPHTSHHVRPLTAAELAHHQDLRFAAIIYYGIKDSHIQRWQEAANFQRGWQVEIDRVHGTTRYAVWPNKDIQESDKQLEPNWFTLRDRQITYQSFIVHSNGDYTVRHVAEAQVIRRLNAQHAGDRVRGMRDYLTVLDRTH